MRIYLIIIILLCVNCDIWCQNLISDSIYIAKGDSCMQQYNMYKAITYYNKSRTVDKEVSTIRKIADCYRKIGNYKLCISWLQKIDNAKFSHTDMRSLYYSYKSLKKKDDMLYWGTRITNLFPFDSEIIVSLSAYYNDECNYLNADSLARSYYKNDSTNMLVNRQLGYACYGLKKYKEALDIYLKLIDYGFDNYESNYIVGVCYEQMDSLEFAYKHFVNAVKFSENRDFNSMYQLGVLCLNMGDATESLDYLRKANDIIQPNKKSMFNLYKNIGASCFKLQKYEEAGCAFEECLKYYSEDVLTYYNAAQMFYAAGEKEKAKKYLGIFIEMSEQKSGFSEETGQLIEVAKQQMKKW